MATFLKILLKINWPDLGQFEQKKTCPDLHDRLTCMRVEVQTCCHYQHNL